MNGKIIDLFDLQNDLGGQSSKSTFFFRKSSRTNRYSYTFDVGWTEHLFTESVKLIDLYDLQNDLGGQSCKSKLFLEKLVEQIVTYTHLS